MENTDRNPEAEYKIEPHPHARLIVFVVILIATILGAAALLFLPGSGDKAIPPVETKDARETTNNNEVSGPQDTTVYIIRNGGDEGIIVGETFYPLGSGALHAFSDVKPEQLERDEIDKIKAPSVTLEGLPSLPHHGVFEVRASNDKELFVVVVHSYSQRESYYTTYALYPSTPTVTELFSTIIDTSYERPSVTAIASDNKYIAFMLNACAACDSPEPPSTIVYDISNKLVKDVGPVLDFRWLDDGSFEYKSCEVIYDDVFGYCGNEPENTPFVEGNWEDAMSIGWQTYRNEEYGFEFRYPKENTKVTTHTTVESRGLLLSVYDSSIESQVVITATILGEKTFEQYMDEITSSKSPNVSVENIIIAGEPARKITDTLVGPETMYSYFETIYAPHDKKVITIKISIGATTETADEAITIKRRLLDQTLSTFRFINP